MEPAGAAVAVRTVVLGFRERLEELAGLDHLVGGQVRHAAGAEPGKPDRHQADLAVAERLRVAGGVGSGYAGEHGGTSLRQAVLSRPPPGVKNPPGADLFVDPTSAPT